MRKAVILLGILIALISVWFFFHPYKISNYFMAEKNVMSIFNDEAIRKELTEEMSQVKKIKYIGYDMYSVKTEEGSYILEFKKPIGSQKHEIAIYSEKSHVTKFIYK